MKEIDIELIKILNSNCDRYDIIKIIQYLNNAKVLTIVEEKVCDSILEQIEMVGQYNITKICDKLGIENAEIQDKNGYDKYSLLEKVDDFIFKKKKEENMKVLSLSLEESSTNYITKEAASLFFNRYVDIINIQEDDVFENLETAKDYNELNKIDISTASEYIDKITLGLKNGTITTIIGDRNIYKSLWAINIAYKAIESDKNVLYISLGTNKEQVYKRFLTRHSRNIDKFNNPISLEEINSTYNHDNYKAVYFDFKSNYISRLIIYDEEQFDISTHHSLQKLIAYAQNKFVHQLGKGIDLVIIDDFSYMKLDNGKKNICNKNIIANEYYKYLRNQSKGLLGTKECIPILITMCSSDNGYGALSNEGNYILNTVLDEVKSLSDNILTIYGDKKLESIRILKLQVIQSINGEVMEEAKNIESECNYWYLKYNTESDININERLKLQEEETNYLKTDNEKLSILNNELAEKFFFNKKDDKEAVNDLPNLSNLDDLLGKFEV